MSAYTHIKTIATALRNSTAIRDYCIAQYGQGCLVQIDFYAADPPSSDDAPFLNLVKVPMQELGQVADADEWRVDIIAGIGMSDNVSLPTVTTSRTATANGLQQIGDAEKAETLLGLALAVVRALALTGGAYVHSIAEDSDGWAELPLQTAIAQITLRKPRDMGEW